MAKAKKVPKQIAGVKLTKPVRRGLRELAASQDGRSVLVEALAAAGAALKQAGAQPADGPRSPAAEARAATMSALEDATRSFTDTLRRRAPAEPPPPQAAAPPPSASPAPSPSAAASPAAQASID